ncbi:uncharacterized protein LOC126406435 [Scomber scombrus]|uniref:Uncharacterized protein LOC126406435 n=1 Tax=Scomber scombrus TaxID=13677 RepID=A0AAV1Q6K7_SCOSC
MEVQVVREHDYCVTPMTSVMSDDLASENEALKQKVQELQNQLEMLQLLSHFGLQRLAGSHEDIRFYTRFASYEHFQAFWRLVEPAVRTKMVRITSANAASDNSNEPTQLRATKLAPLDELLLFLMHLSVGLPLRDLANRFADMAIMVDKGFLVDTLVPCKVYRPAFLSRNKQMCREDVQQTQSIAHLRVHVERCIRRVKENKLFDKVIPLSVCGSIDQLFSVACFLVNYQNGPLVKAWAAKR